MKEKVYRYLLMLGDNAMILGHRLSERCGHGPNLETDIAITNISLDLFGQVRSYFQYAATFAENENEDSIAFLRTDRQYYNVQLVEQPNTDFAHIIVRQFLFDSYHVPLLEELMKSNDETIAAIAAKSIKEAKYHLRFSSDWLKRLGDGTAESHERTQKALDHLYPFVHELFEKTDVEEEMHSLGIGADLNWVKEIAMNKIGAEIEEATLSIANSQTRYVQGKKGIHSEHMGYILSDLQYMQRTYPNMQW